MKEEKGWRKEEKGWRREEEGGRRKEGKEVARRNGRRIRCTVMATLNPSGLSISLRWRPFRVWGLGFGVYCFMFRV
jgi:hypothetical protein